MYTHTHTHTRTHTHACAREVFYFIVHTLIHTHLIVQNGNQNLKHSISATIILQNHTKYKCTLSANTSKDDLSSTAL